MKRSRHLPRAPAVALRSAPAVDSITPISSPAAAAAWSTPARREQAARCRRWRRRCALAVSCGSCSRRSTMSPIAHRSDGSGRSMPGILTKPPSGTAPMPYSVSPTALAQRAAGSRRRTSARACPCAWRPGSGPARAGTPAAAGPGSGSGISRDRRQRGHAPARGRGASAASTCSTDCSGSGSSCDRAPPRPCRRSAGTRSRRPGTPPPPPRWPRSARRARCRPPRRPAGPAPGSGTRRCRAARSRARSGLRRSSRGASVAARSG